MATYTGTATSFADLKTAIENAAVAAGYTLTSDVLSKAGCFYKLIVFATGLALDMGTGQSGSTLTGKMTDNKRPFINVAFPCSYEIFTMPSPDELHCVMNYSSDYYQFMAFGKSDIPGIGGTGGWGTASMVSNNSVGTNTFGLSTSLSQFGSDATTSNRLTGPYCLGRGAETTYGAFSIHQGLDTTAWYQPDGIQYCSSIMASLPSPFNSGMVLMPVKGIKIRSAGGLTIVVNVRNVRYCRIDNVEPKDTISLGSDVWKFYPAYRKVLANRNGGDGFSGTLGFAIKISAAA
jgi:hypothetical protein